MTPGGAAFSRLSSSVATQVPPGHGGKIIFCTRRAGTFEILKATMPENVRIDSAILKRLLFSFLRRLRFLMSDADLMHCRWRRRYLSRRRSRPHIKCPLFSMHVEMRQRRQLLLRRLASCRTCRRVALPASPPYDGVTRRMARRVAHLICGFLSIESSIYCRTNASSSAVSHRLLLEHQTVFDHGGVVIY